MLTPPQFSACVKLGTSILCKPYVLVFFNFDSFIYFGVSCGTNFAEQVLLLLRGNWGTAPGAEKNSLLRSIDGLWLFSAEFFFIHSPILFSIYCLSENHTGKGLIKPLVLELEFENKNKKILICWLFWFLLVLCFCTAVGHGLSLTIL